MPKSKSFTQQLSFLPPKYVVYRASLVFMAVASVSLLVMSRSENSAASHLRLAINDAITPVVSAVSAPLNFIASIGNWAGEMATLRTENIALKNANLELMKWQSAAKDLADENESLRALTNAVADKKSKYVSARIIAETGGAYVRAALVNGGSSNGIKKNQPVISEKGLVGRIIEVGESSSRALLVSDINSRIPVIAEDSREKTILVGNNNELPTLSYIPANSSIKVGERIVTSGDGGIFPRGIAVGIVESVDKGVVSVRPFVNSVNGEYVSIVDYKF